MLQDAQSPEMYNPAESLPALSPKDPDSMLIYQCKGVMFQGINPKTHSKEFLFTVEQIKLGYGIYEGARQLFEMFVLYSWSYTLN